MQKKEMGKVCVIRRGELIRGKKREARIESSEKYCVIRRRELSEAEEKIESSEKEEFERCRRKE